MFFVWFSSPEDELTLISPTKKDRCLILKWSLSPPLSRERCLASTFPFCFPMVSTFCLNSNKWLPDGFCWNSNQSCQIDQMRSQKLGPECQQTRCSQGGGECTQPPQKLVFILASQPNLNFKSTTRKGVSWSQYPIVPILFYFPQHKTNNPGSVPRSLNWKHLSSHNSNISSSSMTQQIHQMLLYHISNLFNLNIDWWQRFCTCKQSLRWAGQDQVSRRGQTTWPDN